MKGEAASSCRVWSPEGDGRLVLTSQHFVSCYVQCLRVASVSPGQQQHCWFLLFEPKPDQDLSYSSGAAEVVVFSLFH